MPRLTPEEIIVQIRQKFGVIGNSPALTSALLRAYKVAPTAMSVIVFGENGSGKEFFPKIITEYSPRKNKPYIAVNCGAIPESTIDSELFGHKKGAYTGAETDRAGYFETANGGTIFLDEIGEMPLNTQARLLRLLESGEFIRMGESQVRKTDVRIIAATNKNLIEEINKGNFREDLFYRLCTVEIIVPPLRDRGKDILLLARMFSHRVAQNIGKQPIGFTDDGKNRLLSYSWPGNVRQLQHLIEQLSIYEEENQQITASIIDANLPEKSLRPYRKDEGDKFRSSIEYNMILMAFHKLNEEIQQIKTALSAHGINMESNAAFDMEMKQIAPRVNYSAEPHAPVFEPQRDEEAAIYEEVFEPQEPADDFAAASSAPAASMSDTYKEVLRKALLRNKGRRRQTAKELKISERTLYRKIKEFGFDEIEFKQP